MKNNIFFEIFNMSMVACWLIFAVIVLRIILKRAPKWITCALWGLVGLKLTVPFSFESVLSLIPSAEIINTDAYVARPYIQTGVEIVDNSVNDYLGGHYFEGVTVPANNFDNMMNVFSVIWLIGIIALLIYTAVSYFLTYKKVRESILLKDNVMLCDRISTPFIFGILKPHIYLPSDLNKADYDYVIAHEKAHLSRLDHIIKLVSFLILTVHWFNPLVWVSYILLCRDIEIACDQKVIKALGEESKKPYSEALVNCSVPKRSLAACPVMFGEVSVKGRIKSVLNYKKPSFWLILAAVIAVIICAVCFLTNPPSPSPASPFPSSNNSSSLASSDIAGSSDAQSQDTTEQSSSNISTSSNNETSSNVETSSVTETSSESSSRKNTAPTVDRTSSVSSKLSSQHISSEEKEKTEFDKYVEANFELVPEGVTFRRIDTTIYEDSTLEEMRNFFSGKNGLKNITLSQLQEKYPIEYIKKMMITTILFMLEKTKY